MIDSMNMQGSTLGMMETECISLIDYSCKSAKIIHASNQETENSSYSSFIG